MGANDIYFPAPSKVNEVLLRLLHLERHRLRADLSRIPGIMTWYWAKMEVYGHRHPWLYFISRPTNSLTSLYEAEGESWLQLRSSHRVTLLSTN